MGRMLGVLLLFAALAPAARAAGADVAHFTLANGLELVVVPDHRTPVVTHMVWYKVGSADETPGKSGLAHFLEHLMFKGTAQNPEGKFSQTVATLGGQENAFTTLDYTAFFQRIAREHLPCALDRGCLNFDRPGRPLGRTTRGPFRSADRFAVRRTDRPLQP